MNDSPARERFLDLATRPLEDNAELQFAARADLTRRIESSTAATDEALKEAAERLEEADGRKWGRKVMAVLSLVALGLMLSWIGAALWSTYTAYRSISSLGFQVAPALDETEVRVLPSIDDPDDRLLLFGDESTTENADQWRPLWDKEPENPVYFANYVIASQYTTGAVSDDLLDHAERIDPDNGWYLAFAAGGLLQDDVLERVRRSEADRKAGKPEQFQVRDEEVYRKARDLLFEATGKPGFSDHSGELALAQFSRLPPADDMAANIGNLVYAAGKTSGVIPLRRLVNLFCHEADRCVRDEDEAGFRKTVNAWRWFVEGFNRSSSFLVDGLVAEVAVSAPLRNFRDAAEHFEMSETAALFRELDDDFEAERMAIGTKKLSQEQLLKDRGAFMARLTIPMLVLQVKSPPPLTAEMAKPGRLADHSFAGRLFAGAMAFVLVLASGLVVAVRFRHGVYGRKLSERICALLRPADWMWMALVGLCLPLVWFLVITRLTPLSSRDWNPMFSGGIPMLGQWGALAVLVFTASASAAAWRLDRRMRFLGRMPRSAWFGFAATACAALAIPVFGAIPLDSDNGGRIALWVGIGLGWVVALWWFAGFFSIATGFPGDGIVRRVAISRLLVPLWLVGALVFAVFSWQQSLEERHWVKRDTLMGFSPEAVGLSRYEGEVTEQLRKELGEVIDRLPEL